MSVDMSNKHKMKWNEAVKNLFIITRGMQIQEFSMGGRCKHFSGADQGFFKRGGAQIEDWQNFGACGDRGCAPSEAEKNCNFQSHFARFGALLFAWFLPGAPTQSQVPYLCKK